MRKKIKEVQDYFKNKLLSGQFKVVKITEHVLSVTVDEFPFFIWVGNHDIPNARDLYSCPGEANFINIELNQKERLKLHSKTKKIVSEYLKGGLLRDKQKRLKALELEIKNIST